MRDFAISLAYPSASTSKGFSMLDAQASPDRFEELASLLALALIRLEIRKSSEKGAALGESSLHILPHQSGCRAPKECGEIV
jgi:hypothetical protein